MVNRVKSEFLKQKHRFVLKLLWIAPIIPIALNLMLMGGRYFLEGAYNWWYTMILPGALTLTVTFTTASEKKHNRHGLFTVCVKKEELWMAQIIVQVCLLFLMNLLFSMLVIGTGLFLGINMPFGAVLCAGCVLTVTNLWQIPLCMYLSEIMGTMPVIVLSLFCNIVMGISFAPTRLWFLPFAVSARLMCPILRVLPSGLPMDASHPLGSASVVAPGVAITVALFVALLSATRLWFQRREV